MPVFLTVALPVTNERAALLTSDRRGPRRRRASRAAGALLCVLLPLGLLLALCAAARGSGHVEAPANGKQSSSAHRWKSYFSAEAEKLKQAGAARGRLAR